MQSAKGRGLIYKKTGEPGEIMIGLITGGKKRLKLPNHSSIVVHGHNQNDQGR
jgi:hypothetical protein